MQRVQTREALCMCTLILFPARPNHSSCVSESRPSMAAILLLCRLSVTSRVSDDTALMCTRLLEHAENWREGEGGGEGWREKGREGGGEGKGEGGREGAQRKRLEEGRRGREKQSEVVELVEPNSYYNTLLCISIHLPG